MKRKIIVMIGMMLVILSMMACAYAESGTLEGELANIDQVENSGDADFVFSVYNYEEEIDDKYYYSSENLQKVISNIPEKVEDDNTSYGIYFLKDIEIEDTLVIPAKIELGIFSTNGSNLVYTGNEYAIENNGMLMISFADGVNFEELEYNPFKNATFENGIKSPNGSGILNDGELNLNCGRIDAKETGINCNNKDAIAIIGEGMAPTMQLGKDIVTIKARKALDHAEEEPTEGFYFGIVYGAIYSEEEIDKDMVMTSPDYKMEMTEEDGMKKYKVVLGVDFIFTDNPSDIFNLGSNMEKCHTKEDLEEIINQCNEYSYEGYAIYLLNDIEIDETIVIPEYTDVRIISLFGNNIKYTGNWYAIENDGTLEMAFMSLDFMNGTLESCDNGIKSPNGSGILNNGELNLDCGRIDANNIGICCDDEYASVEIMNFESMYGSFNEEESTILPSFVIDAKEALKSIHTGVWGQYYLHEGTIIYSEKEIDEYNIYLDEGYRIKTTSENGKTKYEVYMLTVEIEIPEEQKKYVNKNDVVEFYIYLIPYFEMNGNMYAFDEEYLNDLVFKVDGKDVTENVAWGYRREEVYGVKGMASMGPTYELFFITCTNLEGNGKLTIEVPYYYEKYLPRVYTMQETPDSNTSLKIDTGIIVDNIEPGKEATIQKNRDGSTDVSIKSAKDAEKLWIKTGDNVRILEVPTAEEGKTITVAIPKGFEIAELDEVTGEVTGTIEESRWGEITEEDINKGLVIVAKDTETGVGNEFVWIPCVVDGEQDNIEDVIFGETYNLVEFIIRAEESFVEMSLYSEASNPYEDFIEMFTDRPEILEKYTENYYLTYDEMIEAIEEIYKDNESKKQEVIDIFNNGYVPMMMQAQTDEGQKEILDSVRKYHGFYIGRYEIGANIESYYNAPDEVSLNNEISTIERDSMYEPEYGLEGIEFYVQRDKYPLLNLPGYYYYAKIAHNLHPGLTRIMGKYSYSASKQWLQKNKDLLNLEDLEGSGYRVPITGVNSVDRLLNIYDLIGNVPEVIDEWMISMPRPTSLDEVISKENEWNRRDYKVTGVYYDGGMPIGLNPMPYGYYEENVDEWFYERNIGTRAVLFVQELPEWEKFSEEKTIEKYQDDIKIYVQDRAGNISELEIKEPKTSSGGGSSSKKNNKLTANADEYRGYVEDVFHITKENGLLKNDESEKDVKIEVKDVNKPKHGKIYKDEELTEEGINEDGSFYYVPEEGYIGEDTFTYTITDGNNESKEGTVTLVVKEYKLQVEEDGNHTWYIRGYDDGEVKADNAITREEIAMIFYRLTQSKDKDGYEVEDGAFVDVELGRWSNVAISYLKEKGIIQGYPDGTFKPTATVTRAEFVAIVEKYLEANDGVEVNYADVSNGHWAKEMISAVSRKGWMEGYPDETFKPEKAITRAETMTAINRMLNRKLENASSNLNIFPDLSINHWAYDDIIEATTTHEYDRNANGYETWIDYERPAEGIAE